MTRPDSNPCFEEQPVFGRDGRIQVALVALEYRDTVPQVIGEVRDLRVGMTRALAIRQAGHSDIYTDAQEKAHAVAMQNLRRVRAALASTEDAKA